MLTLLDWTAYSRKVGTDAHTKMGPEHRIQLEKAMTFRFGNDETLETRTLATLPVGIAGVNGVLRVHVVPGGAPLLLPKGIPEGPWLPH